MIRPVIRDEQYLTILERSTPAFTAAVERIARARFEERSTAPALEAFAVMTGRNIALSNLLGRESSARVVRAVRLSMKSFKRSDKPSTVIPSLPFSEALEEIRSRTPEVAEYGTREAVAAIIEKGGFTAARAADLAILDEVQRAILRLSEAGVKAVDAGKVIAEMANWSQAYGETVYRTTISGSFSEGRFEQLRTPEAREAIPALRYSAVDDGAVRENHLALDGFVAPVDHVQWPRIKPPNGYRCRCGADHVDVFDYEDMMENGLLQSDGAFYPPNWHQGGPDRDFVKRGLVA